MNVRSPRRRSGCKVPLLLLIAVITQPYPTRVLLFRQQTHVRALRIQYLGCCNLGHPTASTHTHPNIGKFRFGCLDVG